MGTAGRPSGYNEQLADAICEGLMSGDTLGEVCAPDEMPSEATVYRWLAKHPDFCEKYLRAREVQAEHEADEIKVIADTPQSGVKKITKADGTVEVHEGDMTEHRKIRIDARKWRASKMHPKKYGDKFSVEGGERPISTETQHSLSPELYEALKASIKASL